jgi:hypothetical protein
MSWRQRHKNQKNNQSEIWRWRTQVEKFLKSQALVTCICNFSYLGGWDQVECGSWSAWANFDILHLHNNQSKMDWRCGSTGRVLALQVWCSHFKPKSHQKGQNFFKKTVELFSRKKRFISLKTGYFKLTQVILFKGQKRGMINHLIYLGLH